MSGTAPPRRSPRSAPNPSIDCPPGSANSIGVLGGGIVPGSVTLVAGEPGIGKSTLLLQTAGAVAKRHPDRTVLYLSGEESQAQVRMRAARIDAVTPNLLLASTTDLATVLGLIERERPALAIVDSAQTIVSQEVDGISGGSTQVREVASALIDTAKSLDVPVLLVGHVTKDGSIAGPRTLEHLVDVVCQFEGDAQTALRMLRAVKNRFGPTDEVGCFDMSGEGVAEVADPSGLFLSDAETPVEGTCVTFTLDGHRSLPIEVQALVTNSVLPTPRRAVNGVDTNRIAMLVAVLYRHGRINLLGNDLYVSTIAGGGGEGARLRSGDCGGVGERGAFPSDSAHNLRDRRDQPDRAGTARAAVGAAAARGGPARLHDGRGAQTAAREQDSRATTGGGGHAAGRIGGVGVDRTVAAAVDVAVTGWL